MEKSEIIEMAREYVCPGKIDTFGQIGIDLVIGKRQGPYIFNTEGKRFIDLHINGGVFNLGHRHPELIKIFMSAFEELDIGNHHFASEARALLARKLAEKTPGDLHYTVFTSSGSEALDIAIKTARWATKRRQIVSLNQGYHGSTEISGNVGDGSQKTASVMSPHLVAPSRAVMWLPGSLISVLIRRSWPRSGNMQRFWEKNLRI